LPAGRRPDVLNSLEFRFVSQTCRDSPDLAAPPHAGRGREPVREML